MNGQHSPSSGHQPPPTGARPPGDGRYSPPGALPLFIFDGTCGFCQASVRWLQTRFSLPVPTAAAQRTDLAALGLRAADTDREAWFVDGDRKYGGAPAVAAWLRTGGAVPAFLGWSMELPGVRVVSGLVYRVVARNRHRIPGPWKGSCAL